MNMELEKEFVKYSHLGDTAHAKHRGVITIAKFKGLHTVRYGVAFCSPNDKYSRKDGNGLSFERLEEHYGVIELNPKKMHYDNIMLTILMDIYMSNEYRDLAESMLYSEIDIRLTNIIYSKDL